MALTVCPLSNLKLCVVDDMKDHPLRTMLDKNLLVTVNSDDPAYFGGQVNANYQSVAKGLNLSKEDIVKLVRNSFEASFLHDAEKRTFLEAVESYWSKHQ